MIENVYLQTARKRATMINFLHMPKKCCLLLAVEQVSRAAFFLCSTLAVTSSSSSRVESSARLWDEAKPQVFINFCRSYT